TDGNRSQLVPVAERLIYRPPAKRLHLTVKPEKERYVPGERVTLTCSAVNEKGQPAPAVLMVAVVDKSVLTLADEKTARAMPTHFLLTTEVRRPEDLEYADFLLGPHPRAAEALDLLLGTQGWRRFAEQDPAKFRQRGPARRRRAAGAADAGGAGHGCGAVGPCGGMVVAAGGLVRHGAGVVRRPGRPRGAEPAGRRGQAGDGAAVRPVPGGRACAPRQ